ncbi:MAG: LytR/AlgR family response regulator transcription factor [Candidatus Zixiibacteriota bacterium]
MRIRALIIDDEPPARRLIRMLLSDDPEVEIIGECPDGNSALSAINEFAPDLVFLDIQMPGLSGFDVIERLDQSRMPCVIFVTAYDVYALRAFEVRALDYLLKPFEKERFDECVERAKQLIRQDNLCALTEKLLSLARGHGRDSETVAAEAPVEFLVRDGARRLSLSDSEVVWFEAANQYTRAHTVESTHLLSESLSSLESKLNPVRFLRIHRSTIVQVRFVSEVRAVAGGAHMVELSTGASLPVGRRRKGALQGLLRHSRRTKPGAAGGDI